MVRWLSHFPRCRGLGITVSALMGDFRCANATRAARENVVTRSGHRLGARPDVISFSRLTLGMKRPWHHVIITAMVVNSVYSFVSFPLHPPKNPLGTFLRASATSPASPSSSTELTPRSLVLPVNKLISLDLDEMAEVLEGSGRAKMVWAALADGVDPFTRQAASDYLTLKTAQQLYKSVESPCLPWQVVRESVSSCGTRKLLIRLEDGLDVETVVIPCLTGSRSTVCISSQIGCAKNCQFCRTGKMGFFRNLTAGEILGQVFFARQTARLNEMPPLLNAVYMGMGEPLDNPVAVRRSLELLTHPHAFAMARSKVAVSTVGASPAAILRMRDMPCRLAWSVHAATDTVRRLLVPTTSHTMAELRDAFGEVLRSRRREHLLVEVVLIDGVNDSPDMAKELAELLRTLPTRASINLLPYNDIGHPAFRGSSKEALEMFQRTLIEEGYVTTIRTARGDDKSSACGQLATSFEKESQSVNPATVISRGNPR